MEIGFIDLRRLFTLKTGSSWKRLALFADQKTHKQLLFLMLIISIYIDLLIQEVFKSDFSSCFKLCQVLGKCHVMYVKDFIKQTAEVREISNILHDSSY